MSRLQTCFKRLKRPALISFIMAGDPDTGRCVSILKSLPEAGVDVIELGMPFTDPVADGSTIQMAGLRALNVGASLVNTLEIIKNFRGSDDVTPVVLMGYCNPVYQYGMSRFIADAKKAGVDGLILVDMPPEESSEMVALTQKAGLDFIRLITPTTDEQRLKTILPGANGFLYYVSIAGVTGGAKPDPETTRIHLDQIRAQTDLPIAVGFGIRTPEDAASFGRIADGVVVGSAIVQTIADQADAPDLVQKVTDQVQALAKALSNLAT